MDLSTFFVVGFGILFFVGGAAWLEVRSRKDERTDGQGEPPQPAAPAAPARRTRRGRAAEGG